MADTNSMPLDQLYLRVEVFAGANIDHACVHLQALADRLGLACTASMNGVQCMAVVGGNGDLLAERQRHEQGQKYRLKSCSSHVVQG